MTRLDEIKARYAPYNGRTMTFSHERDIDWLISCVQGLNAEVKRLNEDISRLQWFEREFEEASRSTGKCRYCGVQLFSGNPDLRHADDCEYVAHLEDLEDSEET